VVNVGDDLVLHGLTICPDLDTITYTLAGLNNDVLGWDSMASHGESWKSSIGSGAKRGSA